MYVGKYDILFMIVSGVPAHEPDCKMFLRDVPYHPSERRLYEIFGSRTRLGRCIAPSLASMTPFLGMRLRRLRELPLSIVGSAMAKQLQRAGIDYHQPDWDEVDRLLDSNFRAVCGDLMTTPRTWGRRPGHVASRWGFWTGKISRQLTIT